MVVVRKHLNTAVELIQSGLRKISEYCSRTDGKRSQENRHLVQIQSFCESLENRGYTLYKKVEDLLYVANYLGSYFKKTQLQKSRSFHRWIYKGCPISLCTSLIGAASAAFQRTTSYTIMFCSCSSIRVERAWNCSLHETADKTWQVL